MKKLWLLFVICSIFAGCAKDKDSIRVLLDWTPNTNHTGLFVALEKGWFTQEGLKVTITQPPEDEALILAASGKADIAVSFQESLGPAIAKALPITAIAAIISHNTSGIMSLENSGITRPIHLEGKRFASWEAPVVNEMVRAMVNNDGGDFNKVMIVANNAADAISALQTDIDAIWIYYAWDGIAAEVHGISINYIDLGTLDPQLDFYTPVLAARNDWLRENPQTVKKFMSAVSRGYRYAIENPREAAEILLKHAPELDLSLVQKSQEYLASRYQNDAARWGEIDPLRWGSFYRWMFEKGLLETDIREAGFTNEFLP
jgi:ABC-type nitrate/sulfonate/bicarbonate transport system substrate-binding protein